MVVRYVEGVFEADGVITTDHIKTRSVIWVLTGFSEGGCGGM
jgi:hypothetical protein